MHTGLLATVHAQPAGIATGYAFAAAATTPTRDASTHRLLLLSGALEYSTVQKGDEASTHRHSGTRAERRRGECLVWCILTEYQADCAARWGRSESQRRDGTHAIAQVRFPAAPATSSERGQAGLPPAPRPWRLEGRDASPRPTTTTRACACRVAQAHRPRPRRGCADCIPWLAGHRARPAASASASVW